MANTERPLSIRRLSLALDIGPCHARAARDTAVGKKVLDRFIDEIVHRDLARSDRHK